MCVAVACSNLPLGLLFTAYIAQALDLLQMYAHSPDPESQYPPDEVGWLLSLSYTEADAAWASADLGRAKKWLETALGLARFLPGSEMKLAKVSATRQRSSEGGRRRRADLRLDDPLNSAQRTLLVRLSLLGFALSGC